MCACDDAILKGGTPSPANKEKTRKQDAPSSPNKASDPVSDFVTQYNDCGDSPQREKKRTFTQAELEELGAVTRDTEDDMRRKQGPPKAVPDKDYSYRRVPEFFPEDRNNRCGLGD